MPRTRKTTPVSSRTRKQTSARTLRNRGGTSVTKKALIKGLTSWLAPVICTAIGAALYKRKKLQSLLMGEEPKPKKPIVFVAENWGVNSTSRLLTQDFWETNFENVNVFSQPFKDDTKTTHFIHFYNEEPGRRENMYVYLIKGDKETDYNCYDNKDEDNIYIVTEEEGTQKLDVHLNTHKNNSVIHVVSRTYKTDESKANIIKQKLQSHLSANTDEPKTTKRASSTLSNSGNLSSEPPLLEL